MLEAKVLGSERQKNASAWLFSFPINNIHVAEVHEVFHTKMFCENYTFRWTCLSSNIYVYILISFSNEHAIKICVAKSGFLQICFYRCLGYINTRFSAGYGFLDLVGD